MYKKKYNYNLEDIENALQVKSWWAMIFVLPIVRRLSYLVINYTDIKPNTITLISFILIFFSAICFLLASPTYLIFGAIIFEISYILDCIDGTVARVKKIQSNIGSYFDWMTMMNGQVINLRNN